MTRRLLARWQLWRHNARPSNAAIQVAKLYAFAAAAKTDVGGHETQREYRGGVLVGEGGEVTVRLCSGGRQTEQSLFTREMSRTEGRAESRMWTLRGLFVFCEARRRGHPLSCSSRVAVEVAPAVTQHFRVETRLVLCNGGCCSHCCTLGRINAASRTLPETAYSLFFTSARF